MRFKHSVLLNMRSVMQPKVRLLSTKALSIILFISIIFLSNSTISQCDEILMDDIKLADEDINGDKVRVFLIAKNQATISAEISGRIISLPFVMGETFNKGDILVELDSELAVAARDKAEKELEASTLNLEAIRDLRSREDATLVELINAERDEAIAKAGLILAKKNLSMCKIAAPYAGRIVKVERNEHELASSGDPLLSIIDDNTLLAHFLLPISKFPSTTIGTEITITIPLIDNVIKAKISQISATLDAASGTFEVAADIDNSDKLLRAGMSGWFTPSEIKED